VLLSTPCRLQLETSHRDVIFVLGHAVFLRLLLKGNEELQTDASIAMKQVANPSPLGGSLRDRRMSLSDILCCDPLVPC
jgi:hypothetical protein